MAKMFLLLSLFFVNQAAFARPMISCEMAPNPCGMAGATLVISGDDFPNPAAYGQRESLPADFSLFYGYAGATGDHKEGSTILRDQASGLGPYWGFVPRGENLYFVMLAGSAETGFKMGVLGCADSPRVWSTGCKLGLEEATPAEDPGAAPAAPVTPPVVTRPVVTPSRPGAPPAAPVRADLPRACLVKDVLQGDSAPLRFLARGNVPVRYFDSTRGYAAEDLTPHATEANAYVGLDHGDFQTVVRVDADGIFTVTTTEVHGGARCL